MFKLGYAAIALAAATAIVTTGARAAEPALQASYPGDATLSCDGLIAEIAKMESVIGISNQGIASAQGSAKAAELGASAAINGALYSGVLGRVPGVGMFASQGANLMKQRAAAKQKEAEGQIRTAETRRAMLMGIHAGRSCGIPVPAPVAPAPAPPATGTPAVTPVSTAPTPAT